MKLYTKKGDAGETHNLSGQKVSKNDNSIHLVGTLDELNAHLGLVKAMLSNEDSWQFAWKSAVHFIVKIQKNLVKIMSMVSAGTSPVNEKFIISDIDITIIEKEIDRLSGNIPKQHELIIPGKNIIEAQIQITRTVARRAERMFFAAYSPDKSGGEKPFCPKAGVFLNRLSDYLFILSQQESLINVNFINQITGI